MALAVAITGTRSTGHHEIDWYADLFERYVRPWVQDSTHFHIGGATGIDSLTLLWLAGNSKAKITVVTPGTLGQQPPEARQAVERCRNRIDGIVELAAAELRSAAYHARNRYMVDRSDMVIGFPLGRSDATSGTWHTINYGAESGKPRLIIPV
ncbi:hypothetical protein ACIQNU_31520 [Streptomyces sp. NPDC091292]|uniref:hypothetical protein n=1 Tax=Streptomyces sp. NPDC091292 TaxID=3365991 RepID=UPI00382A3BCD